MFHLHSNYEVGTTDIHKEPEPECGSDVPRPPSQEATESDPRLRPTPLLMATCHTTRLRCICHQRSRSLLWLPSKQTQRDRERSLCGLARLHSHNVGFPSSPCAQRGFPHAGGGFPRCLHSHLCQEARTPQLVPAWPHGTAEDRDQGAPGGKGSESAPPLRKPQTLSPNVTRYGQRP